MSQSSKAGRSPSYIRVSDAATYHNFVETARNFVELWPGVWAHEMSMTLATGDNKVKPPMPRPRGRITTYADSAAVVFDKGLDSQGNWVLNSSAPVNLRVAFF